MNGWDAIEAAVRQVYPTGQPASFTPARKRAEGGKDPLDTVLAFWNEEPRPHWHYISFGLTELYDKESEHKDKSGWGFELSFRVASPPATPAPTWPVTMLQMLARYTFKRRTVFKPGDHIDFGEPINGDLGCGLVALAFALDPQLPPTRTPNGSMIFVAPYGITKLEKPHQAKARADYLIERARKDNPLLITDVDRAPA